MASLRLVHRVALGGLVCGALSLAATPSGAILVVSPPPIVAGGELLNGRGPAAEALLQFVPWERFCRWHPEHRLCPRWANSPPLCERQPNHPLCQGENDDRFCERHPDHKRCEKPPSPS